MQHVKRLAAGIPTLLLALSLVLLAGCSIRAKPVPVEKKGYSFWPASLDEPRIQFLVAYNNSLDIAAPEKGLNQLIYGSEPREAYAINKPYGARMWNGCIYLCDVRSKGITVLDLRKQQTRIMGASGANAIGEARDLAIAPDGTKYVVDVKQIAIHVFSPDERFVTSFPLGTASPVGIALFGNLLYVTDFKNAHVKVLDRTTGKELRTIGHKGGEDGEFVGPLGVTTDKEGNVYVSDIMKARVQKFSPEGKLLLAFGQSGDRPGNLNKPKQLGVSSDGEIHIVDAAFNNVQVFDPQGKVVGYYGSLGRHPGAMDLPAGLDIHEGDWDVFAKYVHPAFQPERLIVVANQFGNQKISVYAMGHLKPGKTVADISAGRGRVETGLAPATQPTSQPASRPVDSGDKTTTR